MGQKLFVSTLLTSVLVTGALLTGTDGANCPKPAAKVPQTYRFLYDRDWMGSKSDVKTAWAALPYSRIEIEHLSGGYGIGPPSYVVTLHRNGLAEYHGRRNVRFIGKDNGDVSLFDFAKLCYLTEELDAQGFKDSYKPEGGMGSGGIAVIVRLFTPGKKKPKQIWEINRSGPIKLWAIQLAILAVAENVEWDNMDGIQRR